MELNCRFALNRYTVFIKSVEFLLYRPFFTQVIHFQSVFTNSELPFGMYFILAKSA